jgi:YHS domain-containing protein
MKKIFWFYYLILGGILSAQEPKIMVQTGHSSFITHTVLDNQRNYLITYGDFDDKTVNIWNKSNGLLINQIELEEHATGFSINQKDGILYLGSDQNIIAYDYVNFKEKKRYNAKFISSLNYLPTNGLVYYFASANGKNTFDNDELYTLNPNTGETKKATSIPFPDKSSVMNSQIIVDNQLIRFYTNSGRTFYYILETGEYGEMADPSLGIFNNYDVLYIDYLDDTRVNVIRYSSVNKAVVWEKTIVTEKLDMNSPISSSQVSISPNEESIWIAPGKSTLIELNAETGYVKGVIYNKNKKSNIISDNESVYALVIPDGQFFNIGNYYKFKRYQIEPAATFGYSVYRPNLHDLNWENNQLSLGLADEKNLLYSMLATPSGNQMVAYPNDFKNSFSIQNIGINPKKSQLIATGEINKGLSILPYEIGKNQKISTVISGIKNTLNGSILDAEQEKTLVYGEKSFEVLDIKNKTSLGSTTFVGVKKFFPMADADFAPNGNFVAIPISDEIQFESKYAYSLGYYDYVEKKQLWNQKGTFAYVKHLTNGQLIVANLDTKEIQILDQKTGNKVRSFQIGKFSNLSSFDISPDEANLLVNYDTEQDPSKFEIYALANGSKISGTNVSRNNAKFVHSSIYYYRADNSLNFYDSKSHKELMRIYFFPDNEWIAHTPNGQFDGSQKAWERLVFVKGNSAIPLSQVFDKFYTPRLLTKVLGGEKLEEIDIQKLKAAPKVELFYTENTRNLIVEDESIITEIQNGKITVKANGNGSEISEIRLYHNDKLVGDGTRNLVVEDELKNPKEYVVTLMEGDNKFTAVAQNREGTESSPQTIYVEYKPKKETTKTSGIQLHLLVVGIDKYKNSKYNLNYATADANAFKGKVSSKISSIVSQKNEYYIENDKASREEILKTFQQIISKANEQDIFIFYYAGHGVMTEGKDGQFFIVPHDVTQLYGADDTLAQKGISAEELKSLSAQIKAQKQLYFLDACQSGGVLGTVALRGAAEEKAIAQLARSTGTHWLTASGSEQFATEFDELGHGVFTYVLLEGLSGKADSGDGRITVNELKAYLESQVPEVSSKYKGLPQYPSSFGFGQDFPIGIK